MLWIRLIFLLSWCLAPTAWADPAAAYQQALNMAAQGKVNTAIAMLQGATQSTFPMSPWHARMQAAAALLRMQQAQQTTVVDDDNPYLQLAYHYAQQTPPPTSNSIVFPAVLAALLPGSGHAWLGRWHDAWTAALLVVPMLGLSVWAMRRKMGPVTVFFSLITLWLWSGTVFSTMSLVQRGMSEGYMLWWQGCWLASGLMGHVPW